mmetsp:Transcript_104433/g.261806  ORF Transcript_104433/g.261806 Transcript_104433/m.261806 type:complete len:231 (-) Transcript_104433:211-903(-)
MSIASSRCSRAARSRAVQRVMSLRLVSAPRSSNNRRTPQAVSRRSVSLFDGAAANERAVRPFLLAASTSTPLSKRSRAISTRSSSAAFISGVQPWNRSSGSAPSCRNRATRASSPSSTALQRSGFSSNWLPLPPPLPWGWRCGLLPCRRPAVPLLRVGVRDRSRPPPLPLLRPPKSFSMALLKLMQSPSSDKLNEACVESLVSRACLDIFTNSEGSITPSSCNFEQRPWM